MSSSLPSYHEAAAIIAAQAARLLAAPRHSEPIPLSDAAGRVLAHPIHADLDMPPFPRSTRDGFAVRAAEAAAHQQLRIAGTLRAGDTPVAEPLKQGETWEIMTGAAIPAGADAVVMLEHVLENNGSIQLAADRSIKAGDNITPQGAEARAGDEILPAGTRLTAAHIAAAAACGAAQLEIFRRPRVAILATGDELVPVEVAPGAGQIRNSNTPMLAALVTQAGGEPLEFPAIADTPEAISTALSEAAHADMILLSGGVSAGKFDLVEPALLARGAKFHFTGARIQPGKPVVFGEMKTQQILGLPGNPISSAATFLLFAAPVLRALSGEKAIAPHFAFARAMRNLHGKPTLTRFIPAHFAGNPPEAAPTGWQGSGDVAALARANCFLIVPEGTAEIAAGEIATILLF